MAILIHMGDVFDGDVWEPYISNFLQSGLTFDIYVNVRTFHDAEQIYERWGFEVEISIQLGNVGMDIGGFLTSLLVLQRKCVTYLTVFKLHNKEDPLWTARLLNPLVGSAPSILSTVGLLRRNDVGQIFAGSELDINANFPERTLLSYGLGDINFFGLSIVAEEKILKFLGLELDLQRRFFVAGTMFAMRASVLVDTFDRHSIHHILDSLNSPLSVDVEWHSMMSRYDEIKKGDPGNSLHGHHLPGFYADGQIEHAWERVICYLSPAFGLDTYFRSDREERYTSLSTLWRDVELLPNGNGWNVFSRKHCLSFRGPGDCLKKAIMGECILSPARMFRECYKACRCVHGESGYPTQPSLSDQLHTMLLLHRQRVIGHFHEVSSAYEHVIHCLGRKERGSGNMRRLPGEVNLIFAPVIVSLGWKVNACTRIISRISGNGLFVSAEGRLRLEDESFAGAWSNLPSPNINERYWYLEFSDMLERGVGQLRIMAEGDAGQVVAWHSAPFALHGNTDFKIDVLDDFVCLRILSIKNDTLLTVCESDLSQMARSTGQSERPSPSTA